MLVVSLITRYFRQIQQFPPTLFLGAILDDISKTYTNPLIIQWERNSLNTTTILPTNSSNDCKDPTSRSDYSSHPVKKVHFFQKENNNKKKSCHKRKLQFRHHAWGTKLHDTLILSLYSSSSPSKYLSQSTKSLRFTMVHSLFALNKQRCIHDEATKYQQSWKHVFLITTTTTTTTL